ncbi:MAG: strawberry notch-like NTP hydrolase domain-containing protein [Variibacter sp.]
MPLDVTGLKPLDTSGLTPVTRDEDEGALDASGLKPLDASGLKPLDQPDTSFSDYPVEATKGFAEGAKGLGASALKGFAALDVGRKRTLLGIADRIDRGERVRPVDDVIGYGSLNPDQRREMRAELEGLAAGKVTDNPLFHAGEAVEQFGKETLAPKPGFENSWTRDIGAGLGSMAAGLGLSLIPTVGPYVAGATFVGSGSGEAVDTALKKGATDEQAVEAARFGLVPGSTDVVDMLLPHMGTTGKVLGFVRRVGERAIKSALAEGGQEGVQQLMQNAIAKGIYDPNRDILEDVPRSAAIGAIVGGGVGGGFAALERPHVAEAPAQATDAPASVPSGAINADAILPSSPTGPAPAPASAPPVSGQPVSHETVPPSEINAPTAAPATLDAAPETQGELSGRDTLKRLFDDPRTAQEIRAGMEAAESWQPTPEWQDVPPGAVLPPGLQIEMDIDTGRQRARLMPTPGTRENPVELDGPEGVSAGAEQTAQPTPAQAEAGNYRKRHVAWNGLDISIETEAGQNRTGVAADGTPWSVQLAVPYGYIKRTEGADGDHVDVYVGPHPQSPHVFVFDQVDPDTRKFDEHKLVIGARNQDEARAIYEHAFDDGSGAFRWGAVTEISVDELKAWLKSGNTTKPLSYRPASAARQRGPLSLFQFLASRGGIKDQGGELKALGLDKQFVPGGGRLVRSSGMSLDRAREAAVEAGYLHDPGWNTDLPSTSTPADLLNALDAELRGNRVYSVEDTNAVLERDAKRQRKAQREELNRAIDEVSAIAKNEGINATKDELRQAAELVLVNGSDHADALVEIIERSYYAALDDAVSLEQPKETADERPQQQDEARGESEGGAGRAPAGEQSAGPQAEPAVEPAPGGEQSREGEQPRGEEAQADAGVALPPIDEGLDHRDPDYPAKLRDRQIERMKDDTPLADHEAAAEAYRNSPEHAASRAMEDALDKIEVAVEANDRKGVMDAAREAKRVLAATPQALKDADPDYWGQFGKAIAKMTKPGYVTAKQEIEGAAPDDADTKPAVENPKDKNGAAAITLARSLTADLKAGRTITARTLQQSAERAYGAKLAEGKFDRRDMQDALELAVNIVIRDDPKYHIKGDDWRAPLKALGELVSKLPTQRVRSEEQESFQQFSTPPNYAAAAVYAADIREGDMLLEPSAGTGNIVAVAARPGVEIVVNELSERRAALLRHLVGDDARVFNENAEQLDNILPQDVTPTVVVMNPPFAQTAGRLGNRKDPMTAAKHVEQGLKRLREGGRLVAIVSRGMTMGAPAYRAWWAKMAKEYTLRANIGVDGKTYEKYGTTFGTRLLVFDKLANGESKPILKDVSSIDELMATLEPIRDERQDARRPEPRADQSRGAAVSDAGESAGAGALPASAQSGDVGSGERGGRRVAVRGEDDASGAGGADVRLESGTRDGVASDKSERPGTQRASGGAVRGAPSGEQSETGRGDRSQRDLVEADGRQPGAATGSERVELEQAKPGTQAAAEISDSLYQAYEPKRVRVKGAKPHPGPLVESAAMASVDPPAATYSPKLPKDVIETGKVSLAQLETTVYAGQAHSKMLPAAEGETARRRGYFIGDGTGVGKGREIASIILDNFGHGRTKAIWVSEKKTLLQDAKRDWSGLGQNANVLFDAGKVKTGEPINSPKGIAFMTYDTLKGGMSDQEAIARGGFARRQAVTVNGQSGKVVKFTRGRSGVSRWSQADRPSMVTVKLDDGAEITVPASDVKAEGSGLVKSRVDQLAEWFGEDFDGVIAFDEAHNMANAVTSKGKRGFKDAAQKALAGIELQNRLPNARVVYVSATGATEVNNLAYADRLGLWGRGTPFESREKFIGEIDEGGIAAMELIARDMKQLGLYTARNLSFDGVEYERLEHKLDENQREIYDTAAEAWQVVLRNINAALEETGGGKDARAKSAAMSAFWSAHQRFFNQIISSLQMPSVIEAVKKDLAAGRVAVLQLTNTNEASQERAAAKVQSQEDLDDLDITPRDQIIQLVERSFPTQEYEQYSEMVDGKEKVRSRPVTDSDGNPVQNRTALRMKEQLIERLASIRVPQGPLDMMLDQFGTDVVAEVTGRGRRFVLKKDEETGNRKRTEESRPASANLAETETFQSGKKKILVFSEAGGTGRSYHADNTSTSKGSRRVHYLVQAGWRADKAVQGFGRTHRTNQASAPIVKLVTTDLQGQKRFISSIARRLAQLGALTKGQRQAGDQGVFSARDNLESPEANAALRQFYNDLLHDNVEGVRIDQFEDQTGLELRQKDDEGRVLGAKEELPPITQFLNRVLSLKIEMQNRVFNAFSARLDRIIEARAAAGKLDVGLETVRADKIVKDTETVVHTTEETGAQTKYVKFTLSDRYHPYTLDEVSERRGERLSFFVRSPKGKVYAVSKTESLTDEKGKIVDYYRLDNPISGTQVTESAKIDTGKDWSRIDRGEAEKLWKGEIEKAPEFVEKPLHLVTGAILPIWDRLKGSPRVVRLQTDAGEQFLGRVIPSGSINETLRRLGAEAHAPKVTPESLYKTLMGGGRATLSNGWTFKRSRVANEYRIELTGPSSFSEANSVKGDGVFTERIDYKTRFFVPASEAEGPAVIKRLIEHRPITDLVEPGASPSAAAAGDEPMFALREPGLDEAGAPLSISRNFVGAGERTAEPNIPPHIARMIEDGASDADVNKALQKFRQDRSARIARAARTMPALRTSETFPADGFEVRTPFTTKFLELHRKIYPLMRQELDRIGLKRIGLRLVDRIEVWKDGNVTIADGHFLTDLITVSLEATRKYQILHHEALHGLRQLGAFTEGEWGILERASSSKWRKQFSIERAYGQQPEWIQIEEGVAHAYAAWAAGELKVDGRVARLFKRIRDVLEAIGNALRGAGFKTAEGIFDEIKSGAIGRRTLPDVGRIEPRFAARENGFSSEPGADGKPQLVIPGTEKIQTKDAPKASKKTQKTVDGLPLFEREPDPETPMFALRQEPGTAVQRHEAMQGLLARGQYVDRAVRMPFDFFGGVTRDGVWKPGQYLYDKTSNLVTTAKFSPEGRFSFLNPILENARRGLVDRYGLDPAYVDRDRKRSLDERATALEGAEILKYLKANNVGAAEAKVLQAMLTGEDVTDAQMAAIAEPIRAAVDQLGQEAVDLGLLSRESYERNRGAYLHRVYMKHEADQNGLSRMVGQIMGAKRKKIIGDQFRGRGMFQEITVQQLMRDVPGWREGSTGRPEIGTKFVRLDERPLQAALALDENTREQKPLRTVFWPADKAIPDRYDGFRNEGVWEVRGRGDGKITIWRDFTKDERVKMGEILDARYTIGKTFMLMAHDLANGRFYKDIAENEAWARTSTPNARWLDADEWSAQRQRIAKRGDVEWVRVPESTIPNSGDKKRWGALAGKWVREEIWRDLNETAIMQRPGLWRSLLTQWKLNKTARSPVVHMNNVMSNFVLMDLIDVRMQDFAAGIRSYLAKDANYEEAFQHGAFGVDMISQEVRDQVLKPILEELERNNTYQQQGRLGSLGQVSRFTETLWTKIKALDQKMIDAYRLEDEVFRMATYMRRRSLGDSAEQAAEVAREQFIDYDIRAPWINMARNTVLPFISYTYRAAPLVAKAIATRPWKLAKYYTIAYLLEAMAYSLTGGDEDKERKSLREQEQGKTWIGAERMMRMPVNDRYGNPIFLDIRRWMPAGDVFDLAGGDIPAWMNLGGPLMLGAEIALNRAAFTGEEIVNNKTDDWYERQSKRVGHLYRSWVPSAAWVPESWYWQKLENAAKGATDSQGRPYSIPLAALSSVGIKLKPQDVDEGLRWRKYEIEQTNRALDQQARKLQRQHSRKMISDSARDDGMKTIEKKRERLREKAADLNSVN